LKRSLKTLLFKDREIPYGGKELTSHWIYQRFGILGNAIVGFIGGADVPIESMVDLEDVKNVAPIYSPKMLHFLGEWFIDSLDTGILLQHLFVAGVYQNLLERGLKLTRRGNDIYYEGRKLSVSIATRTPVSVLFHMGINIETDGTPIPTSGLNEMDIAPIPFADAVLARFSEDYEIWQKARVKVLPR
jgi:uncharacterized protein